jgi:hypothetical protein
LLVSIKISLAIATDNYNKATESTAPIRTSGAMRRFCTSAMLIFIAGCNEFGQSKSTLRLGVLDLEGRRRTRCFFSECLPT